MKRSIQSSFAIVSVFFWINLSWGEQSERYLTTTLLPVNEEVLGENNESEPLPDSYLWIQQKPKKIISLQFDLNGLPPDLKEFKACSLRIVASDTQYKPKDNMRNTGGGTVSLTGRLPAPENKNSIVDFNIIGSASDSTVAVGASPTLCKKIGDKFPARNGAKLFTLILESGSDRAGALFYSSLNFNKDPSHLPRLVIQYSLGPPPLLETASWSQHQQNPEHTGRSPWIPFKNPTGFSLEKIEMSKINGRAGSIADYPLIYQGDMYLVNKVEKNNYLVALDFKGKELWRKAIGEGIGQRSPVISRDGIVYVVTENKIAGYDLNRSGELVASYPESGNLPGKLSAYTDLTIGNDGSLFLALQENYVNYIYGFTADLKPFLKSGSFGKGQDKISTVTVSPDGRKIFAQIPSGAVAIDVTNPSPSEQRTITLANNKDEPWEYYQVPVAGPTGDIMIFSDFTSKANKGNVWGYKITERLWSTHDTLIPQPVLGSNGFVYFIQDSALQQHEYNKIGSGKSSGSGLKTTSNLVMDGAGNIYFWDNGYLHGYSAKAERLFKKLDLTKEGLEEQRPADPEAVSAEKKAERDKESSGPEQFIRLMLGPDGTLWANNKNGNALYAFKPRYASADLTLKQEDIKNQTFYRAKGKLSVGSVTINESTQVLFQAQNGISFSTGFKVQKGASIVARTGF